MGLFGFGKKKQKTGEEVQDTEVKDTASTTVDSTVPSSNASLVSNDKRRLIVACGSGVATSQTIASKVKSMLEKDGLSYPIEAVDYKSIKTELKSASIYLYIAKPDTEVLEQAEDLGVNVFAGIPFLTGMGVDDIYEQIKELVKN